MLEAPQGHTEASGDQRREGTVGRVGSPEEVLSSAVPEVIKQHAKHRKKHKHAGWQ